MKTRKQLEAIVSKADRRSFELCCEYNEELKWFFVRLGKNRFVPLGKYFAADAFSTDNLSDVAESRGVEIYDRMSKNPA